MNNTIDHEKKTIYITRAYAKAANVFGSTPCNALAKLHTDYPGYEIKIRTSKITATKKTHKNLTFDRMRDEIVMREGLQSLHLKTLEDGINRKLAYPKVKKWFLDLYPEYDEMLAELPGGEGLRADTPDNAETATLTSCA